MGCEIMTYEEYLQLMISTIHERGDQRIGQFALNALEKSNPRVAKLVRGTDLDPFYKDDRLDAFLIFTQNNWSE